MGQATVDLPDPMQSPAAPATAGTDDLLAQLAGDEIERLLAETETERPGAAPSAAAPVDAAAASRTAREAIAPEPLPASPAAAVNASGSPIAPDAKANLTTQLDELFESLNGAAPAPAASAAAAPALSAPAAVPEPPAAAPAPAARASDGPAKPIDTGSSSAELKALGEPIAATDSAAVAADVAALVEKIADTPESDEDARPSLLVRLLEFINSPLSSCSDPVRQAVGKIAIATLLNAIAVLVYTLVFRHR
jgi:hypothetical protein